MRSQPTTMVRWASLTCSSDWATTMRAAPTSCPAIRISVPSMTTVCGAATPTRSAGSSGLFSPELTVLSAATSQTWKRRPYGRPGSRAGPDGRPPAGGSWGTPSGGRRWNAWVSRASMSAVSVTVAKATTAAPIRRYTTPTTTAADKRDADGLAADAGRRAHGHSGSTR